MADPDQADASTPRRRAAVRLPTRGTRGSGVLSVVFVGLALLGGVAAWPTLQPIFSKLHLGILTAGPEGQAVNVPAPSASAASDQASYQPVSKADRLEAAVMSLSVRQDVVERRLVKAEEGLRAVAEGGGQTGDAQKVAQDLGQLRQEIEALQHAAANVRHLKDRMPLFLLALGQLREAVDRGTPYEDQLRAVAALAVAAGGANGAVSPAMMQRLDTLQTYAAQGVESRVALALRFNDVSSQALREVGIASSPPMIGRLLRWIGSAVLVRRADEPGDVLSGAASSSIIRAGHLLTAGDVNAAVKQLQPVAEQGGEALDAWLKAASGRVAVDDALSELSAAALTQTAVGD